MFVLEKICLVLLITAVHGESTDEKNDVQKKIQNHNTILLRLLNITKERGMKIARQNETIATQNDKLRSLELQVTRLEGKVSYQQNTINEILRQLIDSKNEDCQERFDQSIQQQQNNFVEGWVNVTKSMKTGMEEIANEMKSAIMSNTDKQENKLAEYVSQVKELRQNFTEMLNSSSERFREDYLSQVTDLRQNLDNLTEMVGRSQGNEGHMIAFMATPRSNRQGNGVRGETVKFDKVILNVGNAYDPVTSQFTCPEHGVYVFTWSILCYNDQDVYTELAVNGNRIIRNYNQSPDIHQSTVTTSAVVELSEGDKVWVRRSSASTSLIYGNPYSSFQGFKLN